jgi:hypothetical protein
VNFGCKSDRIRICELLSPVFRTHYSYVRSVFGLYSAWIEDWVRGKGTEKAIERERAREIPLHRDENVTARVRGAE